MLDILLAALPILVVFLMLFVWRKTALTAGIVSCVIAMAAATISPSFHLDASTLYQASVKGFLLSGAVGYVLLFGIFLFHLMNEAGSIRHIASYVSRATDDPVRQVLMLVVAFSPLVESSSGFGIAIIVVAPLLVALGFQRYQAALLALLSLHCVPWGALATGTVIGANLAAVPLQQVGTGSALLSIPLFFTFSFSAVYVAAGWQGIRTRWDEIFIVTATLSCLIWLCNRYVSTELAGVAASLGTIAMVLLILAWKQPISTEQKPDRTLLKAIGPYLFLTGFLVLSRLVPTVEKWLTTHANLRLPAYSFSLPLLYSPGFALLLTCLFSICLYRLQGSVMQKAVHATLAQWIPVTLSTAAYVMLSEWMSATGMTMTLANASALLFGPAFLFISPLIGGLGGFLTGSNTGSNAMFMKLQVQTADMLGLPVSHAVYAQNTASSMMMMASPSRVLLAATVCDIRHDESRLLRQIGLIGAGVLGIISLSEMLVIFWP